MTPLPDGSLASPPATPAWSTLLDHMPIGVVLVDAIGNWVEVNSAMSRLTGLPKEILLTGNLLDSRSQLLGPDGAVLAPADAPAAVALRTGKAARCEALGWMNSNGDTQWLRVSAEPVAGGGALLSLEDVTERRVSEAILAARARLVELAASSSQETVLRAVLDEAEALTGSQIGFLHFVDADQKTLTLQVWSTRTSRDFCHALGEGMHYSIDQAGVWVDAVHQRAPVIHNDYAALPHRKGLPEGHAEVRRELVVPIFRGGLIVALLGVGNKPFSYGSRDIDIVQGLGDLAWDVAERMRAEAALKERETWYRSLFENLTVGAVRQQADGRLTDVNPAALAMLGLSEAEFLGRTSTTPAWDVIQEDGTPLPGERHPSMIALKTGKVVEGEVVGILNGRTGARVWVLVNAIPEFHGGEQRPFRVLITLQDITARKQAEAQGRDHQARFEALFSASQDSIFLTDCETNRILDLNPAFTRLTGYPREAALGLTALDLQLWLEPAEGAAYLDEFNRTGKGTQRLMRIRTRDGGVVWTEANSERLELPAGTAWVHTVRDVSLRVNAELALKESEARWQALILQAGDGIELLDEEGRYLQVNEASCRALGYSRDELLGLTLFDVDPTLTPERFRSQFQALVGRPAATFETVHRRKDGSEFPAEVTASVIRLGDRDCSLAQVRDISEWKHRQAALAASEARARSASDLLRSIFESPRGVIIFALDTDCRYTVFTNSHKETMKAIWDVDIEKGMDMLSAIGRADDREKARRNFERALRGDAFILEEEYGEEGLQRSWWQNRYSPILGEDGSVTGLTCFVIDVTERRTTELALEKAHAQLSYALSASGAGLWGWDMASGKLDWSPEFFHLFGLDPGRDPAEFDSWRKVLHPDDARGAEDRLAEAIAQRRPLSSEYRILMPDGRVRWIQALGSVLLGAGGQPARMAGICLDITERKHMEEELRQSRERYQSFISQSHEAIYRLEFDQPIDTALPVEAQIDAFYDFGYLAECNPVMASMYGQDGPAAMVGKRVLEIHGGRDNPVNRAAFRKFIEGGYRSIGTQTDEMAADGSMRHFLNSDSGFVENGKLLRVWGTALDISAEKAAEAAREESRAQFQAVFENSMDAIGVSRDGFHVMVNPAYLKMFGYRTEAELLHRPILDLIAPECHATVLQTAQDRAAGKPAPSTYEVTALRSDGSTFDMEVHASAYMLGGEICSLVILRDITERKRARLALKKSEAQLKEAQRLAHIGHWEHDHRTGQVRWSEELYRIHGLDPAGPPPDWAKFRQVIHPEDRARVASAYEGHLREGDGSFSESYRVVLADGRTLYLQAQCQTEFDPQGRPLRTFGTDQDVTEQVAAQAALKESEQKFSTIFRSSPDAIYLLESGSYRFLEVNDGFTKVSGWEREDAIGRTGLDLDLWPVPADRARLTAKLAAGEQIRNFEAELRHRSGASIWAELSYEPIEFGGKRCLLAIARDITERKRLDERLRKSEESLATAQRISRIGSWEWDLITNKVEWSAEMYRLFGLDPSRYDGSPQAVLNVVHPDDKDAFVRNMERNLAKGETSPLEYRVIHPDGSVRTLYANGMIVRDPDGRPVQNIGTIQDITERKRAEEEHRVLETQLQRAQKMDSLGSLAGGVAHDMNNVLGAIMALASLHEKQAAAGTALNQAMATITKACLRGRSLVQGLLGFSRQSLVEEKVLELNTLVKEQTELLSRTTLQRVKLDLDLQADLYPVLGDPSALSHLLMNLSVNAIDAMPEGGCLGFRTRNRGQDFVELQIRDTGTGMEPEVLAKATDPFFTTKPLGKGTGLGLSIVYGTVKAHRGQLDIRSEPGRGTTVTILFPACPRAAVPVEADEEASGHSNPMQVLVIDDDELLQSSLAALLESLGHRHRVVGSGEAALRLLEGGQPFDAVILDLNMPGLGGEGTLPQLRALRPRLPVLLATGRATQEALELVERTPLTTFLAKPFTRTELRTCLDAMAGRPG